MKPEIKYLACYRAHRSQYVGEWQYQIEALVNGNRIVQFETARTIKEAKRKFEWHWEMISRPDSIVNTNR